jgi:kumamolisin
MSMASITLKGSERQALRGAQVISSADPAERLQVSVIVRRRDRAGFASRVASLASGQGEKCLSREEFARDHGASPEDLSAVRAFAAAQGLQVDDEHAGRRTVMLSGTVAQFSAAFHVKLDTLQHAQGNYRGRSGAIELPNSLSGVVEAVLGLDNRPQAKPHFRIRPASSSATSFDPTQLAALYGYPEATGEGQTVAIIELGGGFKPADLSTYFQGLGIAEHADRRCQWP